MGKAPRYIFNSLSFCQLRRHRQDKSSPGINSLQTRKLASSPEDTSHQLGSWGNADCKLDTPIDRQLAKTVRMPTRAALCGTEETPQMMQLRSLKSVNWLVYTMEHWSAKLLFFTQRTNSNAPFPGVKCLYLKKAMQSLEDVMEGYGGCLCWVKRFGGQIANRI